MLEKQLFLQPQLVSHREQSSNRKYQSRRENVIVPRSLHKVSAVFTPNLTEIKKKIVGTY